MLRFNISYVLIYLWYFTYDIIKWYPHTIHLWYFCLQHHHFFGHKSPCQIPGCVTCHQATKIWTCLCYQLDILAQNDFLVILGVTNHSILWIRLCGCLRNPVITSWKRSVVFTFHYIFITRVSTCFNHPQPSAVENGGNHPMNGPIPFIYTIFWGGFFSFFPVSENSKCSKTWHRLVDFLWG